MSDTISAYALIVPLEDCMDFENGVLSYRHVYSEIEPQLKPTLDIILDAISEMEPIDFIRASCSFNVEQTKYACVEAAYYLQFEKDFAADPAWEIAQFIYSATNPNKADALYQVLYDWIENYREDSDYTNLPYEMGSESEYGVWDVARTELMTLDGPVVVYSIANLY